MLPLASAVGFAAVHGHVVADGAAVLPLAVLAAHSVGDDDAGERVGPSLVAVAQLGSAGEVAGAGDGAHVVLLLLGRAQVEHVYCT